MKRRTKSPVLDISIRGDQLEHDRIQLEHNLQHTDLSLHLSSSHDDDTIEYARHNSAPSAFPDYISFDHRSRDNFDADMHIPTAAGETVSTAAHHASMLTLSAGLGGRAGRREISLSGAEYDPDRPLHNMMAAVDPKLSMPHSTRYLALTGWTASYSPATRNRLLAPAQCAFARPTPLPPPGPPTPTVPVPVSLMPSNASPSPQNAPRSPRAPHHPNHRHAQVPPSPLTRPMDDTPRPNRRSTPAVSAPSPAASQFTKAAQGLARDLAEEQDRNPFSDIANRIEPGDATRRSAHSKSRVYLPDVTGLTSAVESPAKAGGGYNAYPTDDRPRDSEGVARLLSTLSAVQAQLHLLEEENSISRRRVRELELELEVCKREVVKEAHAGARGAREVDRVDEQDISERYREVVEEKKALESLISSLRSHLTRLTSELSSHQELLTELRKLRERDSRALREKSAEVDRLRQEVERLAGEVEVLRGVVEEGLRERRSIRDVTVESSNVQQSAADIGMSEDLDESISSEEEVAEDEEPLDDRSSIEREEEEESEPEPFDPVSIMGSSRENAAGNGTGVPDRTMRTDHATRGSSLNPANPTSTPFIGEEELARIAADVEERRSNLSSGSGSYRERMRAPTPPLRQQQQNRRAMVEEVSDAETEPPSQVRAPTPAARAGPSQLSGPSQPRRPPTTHAHAVHPPRPTVPTPSRARGQTANAQDDPANTPFPQIRGAHLEQLFFSAPEHNARTCTVCCRRRAPEPREPASRRGVDSEEEDEGFAEGEEDAEAVARQRKREGKRREPGDREVNYETVARKAGLPPQTIVARVIRELEDDFTHYKSVYCELADQYKEMDAVSDVPKRNMLAKHLREVVDILEQKGDQIASLYACLTFKDRPISKHPESRR
ncbi:AAA family ATPase [Mycena sanguinolenta]|uniref:AAA family ATPase n=1 Tax=Mycena sanguinolenta TaxID=230812 RepID=A0A8H7CQ83_9AGAR|nr:AAA family ATPase [Mycena sanguinolenta]